MAVTYVDHMGSDLSVVNAARVSFARESRDLGPNDIGLINFLMRERHASPFEHATLTVLVDTPIGVQREWMRHRTQSFNEFSTRYAKIGEPEFYIPPEDALRTQVGKPGAYHFEALEAEKAPAAREKFESAYQAALDAYHELLDMGVARELARNVLPLGMHTRFYATANLRNWLNFLSLRTDSNALREIRDEAARVEALIEDLFPHTYSAWLQHERHAI